MFPCDIPTEQLGGKNLPKPNTQIHKPKPNNPNQTKQNHQTQPNKSPSPKANASKPNSQSSHTTSLKEYSQHRVLSDHYRFYGKTPKQPHKCNITINTSQHQKQQPSGHTPITESSEYSTSL